MRNKEIVVKILEQYAALDGELQEQINIFAATLLRLNGELSESLLMELEEQELRLLEQIVSGLILTAAYVPDFSRTDLQYLRSSISFGVIRDEQAKIPDRMSLVPPPPVGQEKAEEEAPIVHEQYGRYNVPETIRRLYELEQELGREKDMELGLIMQKHDMRYHCTPPDFIPFASPGVDGIHYCFVTDFGTVESLEEAWIAIVSPMDFGNEIWIVARNIDEFLQVLYTDRNVLYNRFDTPDEYVRHSAEQGQNVTSSEQNLALLKLRETFGLSAIGDMAEYIRQLRKQRKAAICLQTLDSIGVMPLDGARGNYLSGSPAAEDDWHAALDAELPEIRLAAVRNMQHLGQIPDDKEQLARCIRVLSELGMQDECNRLLKM